MRKQLQKCRNITTNNYLQKNNHFYEKLHTIASTISGAKKKIFKEALNGFSPTATYVDLFGGSGLLSHTVKQYYPDANVIYNDFDNYSQRLDNVEKTNNIIGDLREILKDYPDAKRIVGDVRYQVIDRLKQEKGFVDFIVKRTDIKELVSKTVNLLYTKA